MALKEYLDEIGRYPLLSLQEECSLAQAAKEGDMKSRDLLINSNLRFVVKIAKQYGKDGKLEDLIQQGNLGLIHAVDKFNPDLKHKFITYAVDWIRNSIFAYLNRSRAIKFDERVTLLKNKVVGIREDYINKNGREPSISYITKELNRLEPERHNQEQIGRLLHLYKNIDTISLNKPFYRDGDEIRRELIDIVKSKENLEENITNSINEEIVDREIKQLKLSKKTRRILEEVLYNQKKIVDIAEEMQVSKQRVSSAYRKGMKALLWSLENKGLSGKDLRMI